MRRSLLTFFLFLSLVVSMYPLFSKAQTESTSTESVATTTEEVLESISPEPEGTVSSSSDAAFQHEVEEHRALLSKKLQERSYNLLQNIIGRMNAVMFRFESIATRLDSRATILEGEGKSIGDAREHINTAHEKLGGVKRILGSNLGAFAHSENPLKEFSGVRTQIKEAGSLLKDTQTELREALQALKNASTPPPLEATTTNPNL